MDNKTLNKERDKAIADYLSHLKQALHGQDPALILDAQYDAEDHLRSALAEEADPQNALEAVIERYGSPQEIAGFYCDMEAKVNQAFHGKTVTATPAEATKIHRFFVVIKDSQAYMSLLYMLLSLPIGIVSFAWLTLFGLISVGTSIMIVGVPLLLIFLKSMQAFSLFESRLIETLLGQRMPRRPAYLLDSKDWKLRLKAMLANRRTWTTIVYLALRMPLGLLYFFAVPITAMVSVGIFLSPIVDPIFHAIDPLKYSIDIDWYWFPLAMPGGVLGFVIALHGAKMAGWFQAKLAKYLLVR